MGRLGLPEIISLGFILEDRAQFRQIFFQFPGGFPILFSPARLSDRGGDSGRQGEHFIQEQEIAPEHQNMLIRVGKGRHFPLEFSRLGNLEQKKQTGQQDGREKAPQKKDGRAIFGKKTVHERLLKKGSRRGGEPNAVPPVSPSNH
jgi:hypothetical protein